MPNPLRRRLDEIVWASPDAFSLDGVEFVVRDVDDDRPDAAGLSVMKSARMLDAYAEALGEESVRRMVELGIRKGGSAALFALLLEPERILCVDITGPVKPLERFRRRHSAGARITAAYETSQDDEAALAGLCANGLGGPPDLVIDDASHDYALSRASFEILFPRLRPGGLYVIEDWHWAHVPGFELWRDRPALSNLVFQLMMICAAHPQLIAGISFVPGLAFVRKGSAPADEARLDVEGLCWMQGRRFELL